MDANSSQVASSQPSGSRIRSNFSISNDTQDALNMLLDDTPQIPYAQLTPCIDFNASSDVPSTVLHIPISSPEVSTTSTTLKSGVQKYFYKLTVNRARRAQYKLCV